MRAVALVLVAAAALAGCGGSSGGAPRALPSVSSSPSAVPSPTPTGKDAPTPEGAAEFARYFYAEIQRAFETKDPSRLQAVSLPECVACANFIQSVSHIAAEGRRVDGYRITVTTAVAPAITGETARVDIIRSSTDSVEYDKNGKVISREAGHTGIEEQMDLRRVGGAWRVAKIVRIRVRG